MIKSFRSRALRDYWLKSNPKGIKPEWRNRVSIRSRLSAAASPEDMRLPTVGLHALEGDRKDRCAVTVRGSWRITFQWKDGHAVKVNLEDYHGD